MLAAACSGRLTEDWRGSHTDQGIAERLDDDLPDGWTSTTLGDISSRVTSGSRDWKQYYGRGEATFIMAQNVRPGYLDLAMRQSVDPPVQSKDRERTQVFHGDLLVTIVGANTGDVCPVLEELPEHYVCQSVALIRPGDTEMTSYLNLFLNSKTHGGKQFEEFMYGAGRPHLSFDQIRSTTLMLPTLEEQQEIVRRVDALFKLADAVERRVAVARKQADGLPQAILARAFSGKLVPTEAELARQEGREYEPASVLLERIRRERAAQPKVGRSRRRGG